MWRGMHMVWWRVACGVWLYQGVTEGSLGVKGLPLFQQHSSENTLDFQPPASVDIVGSFLLHTLARPNLNVDVSVVMPAACFSRKDTVNHRYHDKRALYLGTLAKAVAASPLFSSVTLEAWGGDTAKPVLVCKPTAAGASKFVVRIHVGVAPGTFQAHRLAPGFNNVRRAATGLVASSDSSAGAGAGAGADEPATPRYNAGVLADMFMQLQLKTFHEALVAAPAVPDALVVLKSWLRCRGDGALPDAFTGFHLTALVVYLLQTRVLADNMVAYQVVRTVLQWLATNSLVSNPVVLRPPAGGADGGADVGGNANALPSDALAAFRKHFDVVMVGPSHQLNLAANMTTASARALQRDAATAMLSMRAHRPLAEGARHVFAHAAHATQRYDRIFIVPYPAAPSPVAGASDSANGKGKGKGKGKSKAAAGATATPADVDALCDRCWERVVEDRVVAVVGQALGERATHVRVIRVCGDAGVGGKRVASADTGAGPIQWGLDGEVPHPTNGRPEVNGVMWLGVVVDPDHANRIVDKGPPADHAAEAAAFRAFWGEKAELRRFQDGSILEAAGAWLYGCAAVAVVHTLMPLYVCGCRVSQCGKSRWRSGQPSCTPWCRTCWSATCTLPKVACSGQPRTSKATWSPERQVRWRPAVGGNAISLLRV